MSFNIVLLQPLVRGPGERSRLPTSSREDANVFIVDLRLSKEYAPSILKSDGGIRDDADALQSLRGPNVTLVAEGVFAWRLPSEYAHLPTGYIYFPSDERSLIKTPFDVMCTVADFPRSSSAFRGYEVARGPLGSIPSVEEFDKPYDFYSAGPVGDAPFDYGIPTELCAALIEWMRSGYELPVEYTSSIKLNVYNRIAIDGTELPERRPNWVMNVETPAIKGLLISTGLWKENIAMEHAMSFTDGEHSQRLMTHSAQYRHAVADSAIKVLGRFAFNNGLVTEDEVRAIGWTDITLWKTIYTRLVDL